jgi:hypothetical protein
MLHDMSFSQQYMYLSILPDSFIAHLKYNNFLDIGSGSGGATVHHFNHLFKPEFVKSIILTDLYPKLEHWKTLKNINLPSSTNSIKIDYISDSVNAEDIYTILKTLPNKNNVSLLGSLHHLNANFINKLFNQIQISNTSLFIIEPKRYSYFLQILHILTMPIFGMIFYTFICIIGSGTMNFPYGLYRIGIVPFYMTLDHIIGASRRYSICELELFASQNNLTLYHHTDNIFDYYIIT